MNNKILDALWDENPEKLEKALSSGEDPNQVIEGIPVLAYAARMDDPRFVKMLLEHGAKVDVRNEDGDTAIMGAVYAGQTKTVQLLVEYGANVSETDKDGVNAFMYAAKGGNIDTMGYLLNKGASLDNRDHEGRTALHWSLTDGDFPEVVKLLVSKGLDPNDKTKAGLSALDYANELGRKKSMQIMNAN